MTRNRQGGALRPTVIFFNILRTCIWSKPNKITVHFILSTFLLIKSVRVYETNSSAGYQKE